MRARPRLIAVDGANGRAVVATAHRLAPEDSGGVRGISRWDASGLFEQLVMNGDDISNASPRLLLLLYAADLAFRLRWEIEPALAEGHSVVAAPYVDTAVALGRALGLSTKWLNNLFRFAARASERHVVDTAPSRGRAAAGFIEFAAAHLNAMDSRAPIERARRYLSGRRRSRARGRGLRPR